MSDDYNIESIASHDLGGSNARVSVRVAIPIEVHGGLLGQTLKLDFARSIDGWACHNAYIDTINSSGAWLYFGFYKTRGRKEPSYHLLRLLVADAMPCVLAKLRAENDERLAQANARRQQAIERQAKTVRDQFVSAVYDAALKQAKRDLDFDERVKQLREQLTREARALVKASELVFEVREPGQVQRETLGWRPYIERYNNFDDFVVKQGDISRADFDAAIEQGRQQALANLASGEFQPPPRGLILMTDSLE